MKKFLFALVIFTGLLAGCGTSDKQDLEKVIQDAFKVRTEAVFFHKDKTSLERYFSSEALEQSKDFLEWNPNGKWDNVKDINYSMKLRVSKLKIDGKLATAEVFETTVVTWDYIDPSKVVGTTYVKEDAWGNKKHNLKIILTPQGEWLIDQDIVE